VVPTLATIGVVKRGYLGAHIRELDAEVAERLKLKDGGVVIAEVYDKTPADKAGLKAGDIVIAINGKPVRDGSALQRIIATLPLDKAIDVDVLRADKNERLTIVVEEQPADYGVAPAVPAPRKSRPIAGVAIEALGIEVAELTDEIANDLGYRPGTRGLVITRVQDGGLGSVTGLRSGAVISKIDDTSVATPAALNKALQNADLTRGILLQVATPQGGVSYVLVKSLR
jgi:serine protease Do